MRRRREPGFWEWAMLHPAKLGGASIGDAILSLLLAGIVLFAVCARAEEPACRRDRSSGFVICREETFDATVRALLGAERERDLLKIDLALSQTERDAARLRASLLDDELRALPPCPPQSIAPVAWGVGAGLLVGLIAGLLLR